MWLLRSPVASATTSFVMIRRVSCATSKQRALLELHHAELIEVVNADHEERSGDWCAECDGETFPCRTLRLLASAYADHPDYNEAWRP